MNTDSFTSVPKGATMVEYVRSVVEWEILIGKHQPGRRLKEEVLAERLGCSRTPVREALILLVGEGLLIRRSRRGVVPSADVKNRLVELADALAELQILCAVRAIERLSPQDKRALYLEKPDFNQFWVMLKQGCGNLVLFDMMETLRIKLKPFFFIEGADGLKHDHTLKVLLINAIYTDDRVAVEDAVRKRRNLIIDALQRIAQNSPRHFPESRVKVHP